MNVFKSFILFFQLLPAISLITAEVDIKLPSIWSTIGPTKSYHLIFQLSIAASAERLTIEEWASFDEQLFRLDLVAKTSRTTYLTNGLTGEIFRYKPFGCELLAPDAKDFGIISDLFKGYSLDQRNSGSVLAYGMGPLWLWAEKEASSVKLSAVEKGSKSNTLYNVYETSFDQNQAGNIRFGLKFYFRTKGSKFVDGIEWKDSKESESSPKPAAMAKLTLLDLEPIKKSVFDIPIGYGCVRNEKFDHSMDISVKHEILHQGSPNQAIIEVMTSRPKDKTLETWDNQKYTIRLLKGSFASSNHSHSYYVIQTQSRDPENSHLKRVKHIWSALETSDSAMVYEINVDTRECIPSFRSFKDHVKLDFPGVQGTSNTLVLSTDLIGTLFSDREGYHMLKESQTSAINIESGLDNYATSFRDSYYEKRLKNFKLSSQSTVGPISIVKKITSYAPFLNNPSVDKDLQRVTSTYHKTVSIYFYSDDSTKILYKAVIDLVESKDVDVKYLHKELDISMCFSLEQQKDIVIKYSLDMQDLGKRLYTIQDLVEEIFIMNLVTTTPIQPIQVSNIELNFDTFFMYVELTLLDLPLTHLFDLKHDKRLISGEGQNALVELIASNLEKCAESCDFYTCYRFSYDLTYSSCRLEVKKGLTQVENCSLSMLFESLDTKTDSVWSKMDAESGHTRLRPHSVLNLLNQVIEDNQSLPPVGGIEDYYTPKPLILRIEDILLPNTQMNDPEFIELKPSSIEADMESMNEYVKEDLKHTDGSNFSVIQINSPTGLRLQYSILLESREFYDSAEGKLIEGVSYDDCMKSCEDIDCRSFSYCNFKDACHLTSLHKIDSIKSASFSELRCTIFSLDYMSKFDSFGSVLAPIKAKSELTDVSQSECAAACMEQSSFNCQGFYHCRLGGSKYNCYMVDKHIEEETDPERPRFNPDQDAESDKTVKECTFYSRSYLAQFDKYYDKALEFNIRKSLDSSQMILNEGAESCAQKCIQASCLAFDVCVLKDGLLRVCHLVTEGIKKDHLVSREKCNTFVLSDKSQYNIINQKLFDDKPNKKALENGDNQQVDIIIDPIAEKASTNDLTSKLISLYEVQQDNRIIGGSHWLSKFLTILFGLIVGMGCASLWNKRDDIYIYVSGRYNNQRRWINPTH